MSDTISQMAKQYENAAATIVTDEELEEQQKLGREVFEEELANNLEGKEDNLLYNDIIENTEGILDEIFEQLIQREVITISKSRLISNLQFYPMPPLSHNLLIDIPKAESNGKII